LDRREERRDARTHRVKSGPTETILHHAQDRRGQQEVCEMVLPHQHHLCCNRSDSRRAPYHTIRVRAVGTSMLPRMCTDTSPQAPCCHTANTANHPHHHWTRQASEKWQEIHLPGVFVVLNARFQKLPGCSSNSTAAPPPSIPVAVPITRIDIHPKRCFARFSLLQRGCCTLLLDLDQGT
jgi:hypothetical protein